MKIVTIILLTVTLLLITLDIFLAFDVIDNNTISELMAIGGEKYPVIPISWGILIAHFFFLRDWKKYANNSWWYKHVRDKRYAWLAFFWAAVSFASIFEMMFPLDMSIYFVIGTIIGYELWPQFKENFNE